MTPTVDVPARAPLPAGILLQTPSGDRVAFGQAELALGPGSCRLELQVDLPLCQLVERRGLLNLRPELRATAGGGRFKPQPPICISAELRPDLAEALASFGLDAAAAAAWLGRRAAEAPDDLIFESESWFARELTQSGGKTPRGYRTVWYYLPFAAIAAGDVGQEQLAAPLLAFLREREGADLAGLDSPLARRIFASVDEELRGALALELGELFGPPAAGDPLAPAVLRFFAEEGWEVRHDEAQGVVYAAFKGEHGLLSCTAQIAEAERQLICYSHFPQRVAPPRLAAMAELLARLNSGLALGNFELDFADGQVRFKTSIDVTGDRLSSALVRRVVYPNVATMDYYLPALGAVAAGSATPLQALALAEPRPVEAA
jgi:hypothetical protein